MNHLGDLVTLVNLTPHAVTVFDGEMPGATWAPSGVLARRAERIDTSSDLRTDRGPVPIVDVVYAGSVSGLPRPESGVAYIVSRVLADAVRRADLYFPADEVRDGDGRIVGCRALGRFLPEHGHDRSTIA